MSKTTKTTKAPRTSKTSAPAAPPVVQAPPAPPAAPPADTQKGAGADALKGRIGSRTHAIHVVLRDATTPLSTKIITARAAQLLGAPCNATASHLNTMRVRGFIVRAPEGGWVLSEEGRKLIGAPQK